MQQQEEIEKFSHHSQDWWNEDGSMKMLHRFNPIRIDYIKKQLKEANIGEGSKILDLGCGCGVASETLSKEGFDVVGIDPSNSNIEVAKSHAAQNGVLNVKYCNQDDFFSTQDDKFDAIIMLEVIEHVHNLDALLQKTVQYLKPGGIIVVSTINKTAKSFLFAKLAAEYIIQIVPRGTHSWNMFMKPSQVAQKFEVFGFTPSNIQGVSYCPFRKSFDYTDNLSINYFITFKNVG